jgi:hypothetical protein
MLKRKDAFKRYLIQVRALKAAHQVKGVHARHR